MAIQPILASTAVQPALSPAAGNKDTLAKIQKGATDFEALLLAQMLKSARETSGGGGLSGDDSDSAESSTMVELGEQQFAQALASNGGLGIAKMVVTGLKKNAD